MWAGYFLNPVAGCNGGNRLQKYHCWVGAMPNMWARLRNLERVIGLWCRPALRFMSMVMGTL